MLPSELTRRALHAGLTPNVAERLETLMAPASDRAVLIRLQNNIFARAVAARDFGRAERSALRRALLDPADHRPWIDVAAAREGQGALAGALQALGQRPAPRRRRGAGGARRPGAGEAEAELKRSSPVAERTGEV